MSQPNADNNAARADLRRYPRRFGNMQASLKILDTWGPRADVEQPIAVTVRNISLNGVGFLFSEQLFPDDLIVLDFGKLTRKYHVARCRRLAHGSYEIGAQLVAKCEGEA